MKENVFQPNIIRKLIDLPMETASGLALAASRKKMSTKPYMEQVLIRHEKNVNRKQSKSKK